MTDTTAKVLTTAELIRQREIITVLRMTEAQRREAMIQDMGMDHLRAIGAISIPDAAMGLARMIMVTMVVRSTAE